MFKPKLENIILFFFLKYLVFYTFMMFKNNDYTLISFNQLIDANAVGYYLWIFLSLPAISTALFSVPVYFILKIRKALYLVPLVIGVFVIEYYLYTYMASESNLRNGIYLEVISIIILILFFFKHFKSIFLPSRVSSRPI